MKYGDIATAIDRYNYELLIINATLSGDKKRYQKVKDGLLEFYLSAKKRKTTSLFKIFSGISISLITLITRGSVMKGKSVSDSYKIEDKFFIESQKITDFDKLKDLVFQTMDDFFKLNYQRNDLYSLPIRKTIDYINEHTNEKITLDILARHVKLNKDYLSAKFKEETKSNIIPFIIDKKILLAREEIKYSGYNKDVYKKFGFSTQSYFILCFKRKFGMSPKEYWNKSINETK